MKKIVKLILVILWMLLIFSFSNQKAKDSSKLSDGIIVKIANVFIDKELSKEKQEEILEKYTTIVRKTAHFVIYSILGILVFNLLCEYNVKHLILISLLICMLYSASDEFHQLFIDGRSGEIRDILIDTMGSLCGITSYYILRKKIVKKN